MPVGEILNRDRGLDLPLQLANEPASVGLLRRRGRQASSIITTVARTTATRTLAMATPTATARRWTSRASRRAPNRVDLSV